MTFRLAWGISAAAALLLAGCGGGGGGGPKAAYEVRTAMGHLLGDSHSWTVVGNAPDGTGYSVTLDYAPAAAAAFPIGGAVSARTQLTATVRTGGTTLASSTEMLHFNAADLSVVGLVYDVGGCAVATANQALPATAHVGDGGDFFRETDLMACTAGAASIGTTLNTWSLVSDAGIALLCWTSAGKDAGGADAGTLAQCFETTADGDLGALARVTITLGGRAVVLRNF